ncbi:tyrosine-protein phosphatase non-receptor type 1 isoform X2 [Phyllopteryx taeniolatus]|uniref:tyrosine-protein phosphatase non-receptor type 1 isoform X2 n=1 Tax=Phyllopteryx taeniolatus TaxID=161469 RepID=UPI002AD1F52B|nr:tyrosine-protein phosphatase non-receptor type 1 isoform X2 [Phyllopteryx taeniolatus]
MTTGFGAPFTRRFVSSRVNCPASWPNYQKTRVATAIGMLAHGPLPNTCGHFWEMVWEQQSYGVVMLNRVIEKGSVKCAQYWPHREERDAVFEDTNFKLTFVSEDIKSYYTVRHLELANLSTLETREILHFHYTTWPDFGVPESPASFLNFLFKVREAGCMNSNPGPVVVHCSAGIGRSGTFCLVDTCLLLMSLRKDPSSVRIRDVLLEMRRHRMGLIQTADQLRFSYLAVIEGAKYLQGDLSLQESWREFSNGEDDPPEFTPPPPLPPPRDPQNGKVEPVFFPKNEEIVRPVEIHSLGSSQDSQLRRRTTVASQPPPDDSTQLDDHVGVQGPSQLQHDTEQRRAADAIQQFVETSAEPDNWSPFLANVCLCTALVLSAYVCYRVFYH